MTTDFTYGNKAITISGPTKPATVDSPNDLRTRVKTFADIRVIPMPYVGMTVTVLADETNNGKMTDYKVLSLKANNLGIPNTVINEIERYVDYLGAGSVSQDDINTAVNNYLTENPVSSGATTEQANQIEANKTAIGDENSGLIKGLNDIASFNIPGFIPSDTIYEFDIIDNSHMNDIDSKTNSLTADEFLSNWYDIYVGLQSDGMIVTKNFIGNDNSGAYNIYEYDFKPKNYNRTILLTSGLHSYEQSAQFGLAYFIKDLMTTPYKHEGFKYIRENVRIKVIPMLNPWGYNQNPQVYGNNNKVNPNRNWDINGIWEDYPVLPNNEWNWKGTKPFSEQETKNQANWLYYNKNIVDFWIDCHTGNGDTSNDIWCYYMSYNPLKSKIEKAREKLVARIKTKYGVSTVVDNAEIDHANSLNIQWSELAVKIPMLVLEQSPLNAKWKTGSYEANGGSIREYATQLYVFIQELLSKDEEKYSLLDYIYYLKDKIDKNSCEQIPFYTSSGYNMFMNAGSNNGGNSGETGTIYDLKTNIGGVDADTGAQLEMTNRMFTDYIPVTSTSFKLNKNETEFLYLVRCYDESKNYLGNIAGKDFSSTFSLTLLDGTKYVLLTGKKSDGKVINTSEITGKITLNSKQYSLVYDSNLSLSQSTETFELSETSITIPKDGTKQLTATLNRVDVTSSTTWISDSSNATVVNGLVTGVTEGNATITATNGEHSKTCLVNVVDNSGINMLNCTRSVVDPTGAETSSTTRITSDYIPVEVSSGRIKITISNSNQFALRLYDSDKTFLGVTKGTSFKNTVLGWGEGTENITDSNLNSNVSYIRLLFRKDSSGTSEFTSIEGTLTINDETTYTLTMA